MASFMVSFFLVGEFGVFWFPTFLANSLMSLVWGLVSSVLNVPINFSL